MIDGIEGRARCVAVDQRGWGESIATDGRYDLAAMAGDVQGVVAALCLQRYVLVGHSMGGKVVQIVAASRPSPHSTVLRMDAAMGQDGHACMASAETSRNSFSVGLNGTVKLK
jgi:pimeloyl-ACP methyl ester carboxylesterase